MCHGAGSSATHFAKAEKKKKKKKEKKLQPTDFHRKNFLKKVQILFAKISVSCSNILGLHWVIDSKSFQFCLKKGKKKKEKKITVLHLRINVHAILEIKKKKPSDFSG